MNRMRWKQVTALFLMIPLAVQNVTIALAEEVAYKSAVLDLREITEQAEAGYTWDGEILTITEEGLTISDAEKSGIFLPDDAQVVLNGDLIIDLQGNGSKGISAVGSMSISGDGNLYITAGCGLMAWEQGDTEMAGGIILDTTGEVVLDAGDNSIFTNEDCIIQNAGNMKLISSSGAGIVCDDLQLICDGNLEIETHYIKIEAIGGNVSLGGSGIIKGTHNGEWFVFANGSVEIVDTVTVKANGCMGCRDGFSIADTATLSGLVSTGDANADKIFVYGDVTMIPQYNDFLMGETIVFDTDASLYIPESITLDLTLNEEIAEQYAGQITVTESKIDTTGGMLVNDGILKLPSNIYTNIDIAPMNITGTGWIMIGDKVFSVDGENQTEEILDSENMKGFVDVHEDDWFYTSVWFVVDNQWFEGVSKKEFAPDVAMSRAMWLHVIYRMTHTEESVSTGALWYEQSWAWGQEMGYVDGTNPEGDLTREELVHIAYLAFDFPETTGELSAFSDEGSVSDGCREAMAWAVEWNCISGNDEGDLLPQNGATRAEVASFLVRMFQAAMESWAEN